MAIRNRNPSEPRRADSLIARVVSKFSGMITGEPATKLPNYLALDNFNTVDRGDYFDIRGGSRRFTSKSYLFTGGYIFVVDWDGNHYLLTYGYGSRFITGEDITFNSINGLVTPPDPNQRIFYIKRYYPGTYSVHPTRTAAINNTNAIGVSIGISSDTMYYGKVNGYCDHVKKDILILMLGEKVYVVDKAITTFTRVAMLDSNPPSGVSTIKPFGDNAILASASGIFKIILTGTFYYMVKINGVSPDTLIADINETGLLIYGYLYIQSLARIIGGGTGDNDRSTNNALLQMETGTCLVAGQERDYGEVYFQTEVGVNLANNHIIGDNILINTLGLYITGEKTRGRTHMPLYRTKNIGENSGGVSATVEGIGNRRDQFIWNADVPLCKALIVDTQTIPGSLLIVGTGNKFCRGDVGSRIRICRASDSFIGTARITGFTSVNVVTITAYVGEVIPVGTDCYACIGGYRVMKANQVSYYIAPAEAEDAIFLEPIPPNPPCPHIFSPPDVGRIIFISDGTIRHIKSIERWGATNAWVAIVEESGAAYRFTGLAVAMQADTDTGTAYNRAWNDTIPDKPQADGRVSLRDRIEYGTDLYIPRRFFRPMPNADIAHLDSGFLVTALRDSGTYSYCQTGDKSYCIGQYKYPEQKRDVVGSIRHIIGFPFRAVIIGRDFTGVIALNSSVNIGRTEIGENIYQLPEMSVVDPIRGVMAWKLIVYKNANLIFAITNEGAFRYFDGTAWSKEDFGFNSGLDAVSKEFLRRIDHSAAFGANYNSNGGIKLWMQRVVSGANVDVCLRFATEVSEGRGWSEIGNTHWVKPFDELGIFTFLDANGVQRVVILDRVDYNFYEIDTFDRITQTKKFPLDKESVQNAEISWHKRWREEVASIGEQHKRIAHEKSYVNILPEHVENRGAAGYTATGQRGSQELSLSAYLDGERTTAEAETEDFPENGEMVFSGRRVEANTIMMELEGTASEIQVTTLRHDFLTKASAPSRERREMNEHALQEELAQDKVLHICRTQNTLLNRVTNVNLGAATMLTGADSRDSSAHRIAADVTLDNPAIAGVYTIIIWSRNANLFTGVVGFTAYGAAVGAGVWQMYYKQNTGLAASLTLRLGDKFDIRIYDKTISADSLAKLYDDIANFEGRMMLPGF